MAQHEPEDPCDTAGVGAQPHAVAADSAGAPLLPLVVGANQHSSSLGLRDRLFVEEHAVPGFLQRLREAGVGQAMLLQTCDRIEVHAVHRSPGPASRGVTEVLAAHAGTDATELREALYILSGEEAVHHLFAVCASLDSTVIGEPHVLGQVKDSYREAQQAGSSGSDLEALVQRAFAAAKRVRTETAIGEGPVSIAAAAVELTRSVHGDLDRLAAVMLGSGEMAALIAQALREAGLSRLTVLDTRPARAEAIARHLACHAGVLDDLAQTLPQADIVVGGLGQRSPPLTVAMVRAALKARRNRPVVLIDAAVPGDIDRSADAIDGVFLYSLDDLECVARDARQARAGEIAAARAIIAEETAAFLRARAERAAVPAVTLLRGHVERLRQAALADAGGDAEKATRLLASRMLHEPTRILREVAGRGEAGVEDLARMEMMLMRLFDLDDRATDGRPPDGRATDHGAPDHQAPDPRNDRNTRERNANGRAERRR